MISRQMIRAVPARALLLTLMLGASLAQAVEPTVLKPILAQVKAMPAAPAMTEEDFSRRARVREVKLSPDGKTLAYLDMEGATANLMLLDVASGARRKLASSLGRTEVFWSGDSATLFLDGGDALSIVTVSDGALRRIASFDRKQNQRFLAVDDVRGAALADEYDKAKKQYRFLRIAADGSREVLYEGERKLKDYLFDEKGQLAFTVAMDEQYYQIVSRKQDGKWAEVTRCKRRRTCTLVAASPDQARLTMITATTAASSLKSSWPAKRCALFTPIPWPCRICAM
jgi:dipeptidyl aminopeptidase/acylaminoacyl peptidase